MKKSCYDPQSVVGDAQEVAKIVRLVDDYVASLEGSAPYSQTNNTVLIRYNNMLSAAKHTTFLWRSGGGVNNRIHTLFNQALNYAKLFNEKYNENERLISRIKKKISDLEFIKETFAQYGMSLTPEMEEKLQNATLSNEGEVNRLINFLRSVSRDVNRIKNSAESTELELWNFHRLLKRDGKEFHRVKTMFEETISLLEEKTKITKRSVKNKKKEFESDKNMLSENFKAKLDKDLKDFEKKIDEQKKLAKTYFLVNIGLSVLMLGGFSAGAVASLMKAGKAATRMKTVGNAVMGVTLLANLGLVLGKYFTSLDLEKLKNLKGKMTDWIKKEMELEYEMVLLAILQLDMDDLLSAQKNVDSLLPKLRNSISAVASLQVTLCETSNYLRTTISEAERIKDSAQRKDFLRFKINEIKFTWERALERVMHFADYLKTSDAHKVVNPIIAARNRITDLLNEEKSNQTLTAEKANKLAVTLGNVDILRDIKKQEVQEMAMQIGSMLDGSQCHTVLDLVKDLTDLPCNIVHNVRDACHVSNTVISTTASQNTTVSGAEQTSDLLAISHIENLVEAFKSFTKVYTMINATAVESLCTVPTINDTDCNSVTTYPRLYTLCNPTNITEFCGNLVNATNSSCNSTGITNTTTEAPFILNKSLLGVTTPSFVHITESPVMLSKLTVVDPPSFNELPGTKHGGSSAVTIRGFINCENISLASCIANTLDGKGKRYEQIQQIAPYTHAPGLAANESLTEFKLFVRKELRHYSKADRADVHSELVGVLPKIRDDLQRSVELEGRHGLRHCLKLHKKQFSELLSSYEKQPAKVSTFLSCPDLEVLASTTTLL